MTDYHRRVLEAARQLGIEGVYIEHRGQPHPRLVGIYAGHNLRYPIAGSPRGSYAHKPTIANLRRYLAAVANEH